MTQPTNPTDLPIMTGLTPLQADGLACVRCGKPTMYSGRTFTPVGRSASGSQVFACGLGFACVPAPVADPADTVRPDGLSAELDTAIDLVARQWSGSLADMLRDGLTEPRAADDYLDALARQVADIPNCITAGARDVILAALAEEPADPAPMTDREALIAGLRDLTSYLEANPSLDVYNVGVQITHLHTTFPERRAAVDADAAVMGVPVTDTPNGNYKAERRFGPRVELCSVAIRSGVIKGLDGYTPPVEPVPADEPLPIAEPVRAALDRLATVLMDGGVAVHKARTALASDSPEQANAASEWISGAVGTHIGGLLNQSPIDRDRIDQIRADVDVITAALHTAAGWKSL